MMDNNLDNVITILKTGGIGVLPTDTVYGVVARAEDRQAVERLYRLKRREHKPGTVIAADTAQLIQLGAPQPYIEQIKKLWPNPLSIVIPLGNELAYLHQDVGSQPFRVVADEWLAGLLRRTGPLVTSSANQPGEAEATTILQARNYFNKNVDFYVDHGDLSGRQPSTIIRLEPEGIKVLREGAFKTGELIRAAKSTSFSVITEV